MLHTHTCTHNYKHAQCTGELPRSPHARPNRPGLWPMPREWICNCCWVHDSLFGQGCKLKIYGICSGRELRRDD
eukprot:scaffold44754_cov18-Tisochrysis_lutea.AAC.1